MRTSSIIREKGLVVFILCSILPINHAEAPDDLHFRRASILAAARVPLTFNLLLNVKSDVHLRGDLLGFRVWGLGFGV